MCYFKMEAAGNFWFHQRPIPDIGRSNREDAADIGTIFIDPAKTSFGIPVRALEHQVAACPTAYAPPLDAIANLEFFAELGRQAQKASSHFAPYQKSPGMAKQALTRG